MAAPTRALLLAVLPVALAASPPAIYPLPSFGSEVRDVNVVELLASVASVAPAAAARAKRAALADIERGIARSMHGDGDADATTALPAAGLPAALRSLGAGRAYVAYKHRRARDAAAWRDLERDFAIVEESDPLLAVVRDCCRVAILRLEPRR